jgi:hypothetical protein
VAGVVDLCVVVLDAAQRVWPQRGRQFQRLPPREMPVHGHRPGAAEHVIQQDAGADVRAFPLVSEREQERDGVHQVGAQLLEQEAALAQRFPHQAEVPLFEVAQAAVNQLARPAGRS